MKSTLVALSLLSLLLFNACDAPSKPLVGLWKASYDFENREVVVYRLFEPKGKTYFILEARHSDRDPSTVFAEGKWAEEGENTLWFRWEKANIDIDTLPQQASLAWEPEGDKGVYIGDKGRMLYFTYQERADIKHFLKLFKQGLKMKSHPVALNYITGNDGGSLTEEEKNPPKPTELSQVISELEAQMVTVKGGSYTMGCTEVDRKYMIGQKCLDNLDAHPVRLSDYKIGKFEVTQEQWYTVMRTRPWSMREDCLKCPAAAVSWEEVQQFITKINKQSNLTFRLPTEAEWEYAVRGGRKGVNSEKHIESGYVGEMGRTAFSIPVGQNPPNQLGLYDMMGNVGEWCSDWYDENYYQHSPIDNPKGPAEGETKVFRGPYYCLTYQSAFAPFRFDSESADRVIGFRLAAN